jgi:hypothetical protein
LVWGWQSLISGGPFVVPAQSSQYTYKQFIIILSDGLNTQDRFSSFQSDIDQRMYDPNANGAGTCANIKAAGITIYTIQVNTGGDPTLTLLTNCGKLLRDQAIEPNCGCLQCHWDRHDAFAHCEIAAHCLHLTLPSGGQPGSREGCC